MLREEDWFDKVGFGEGIDVEDSRPTMSKDGF